MEYTITHEKRHALHLVKCWEYARDHYQANEPADTDSGRDAAATLAKYYRARLQYAHKIPMIKEIVFTIAADTWGRLMPVITWLQKVQGPYERSIYWLDIIEPIDRQQANVLPIFQTENSYQNGW